MSVPPVVFPFWLKFRIEKILLLFGSFGAIKSHVANDSASHNIFFTPSRFLGIVPAKNHAVEQSVFERRFAHFCPVGIPPRRGSISNSFNVSDLKDFAAEPIVDRPQPIELSVFEVCDRQVRALKQVERFSREQATFGIGVLTAPLPLHDAAFENSRSDAFSLDVKCFPWAVVAEVSVFVLSNDANDSFVAVGKSLGNFFTLVNVSSIFIDRWR